MYRPFLHLVLVLSVVWPTTVSAESTQEVQDQRPFAQVLHHFDLRIRNDIFHNGGLGNTLAIVPGDRGLATPQIGDDPQIATKNLPKEIIEKIQVSNQKTRSEEFTGKAGDPDNKTINITLKEDKNKGCVFCFKSKGFIKNRLC